MDKVTVAAVQAAPVFFDRSACVERACERIAEAGAGGAGLVVLPEAFVPGFPFWADQVVPWTDELWFGPFLDQSVVVPGPDVERLGAAARSARAYVTIGVNEREQRGSTIYNTLLFLGPDGTLLGKHRKLMPTGSERLVWGMGDGSTLRTYETPFGRLGGLICWENYMPLARYTLYAEGIDVWVAPTLDSLDPWVATLRHIACEGRVHVIGAAPFARLGDVPAWVPDRDRIWNEQGDVILSGYSAIVAPAGELLAGPLVGEEGILYAEVDAARGRAQRQAFDPAGHYQRPDVFQLTVDRRPKPRITLAEEAEEGESAEA